MRATIPLWQDEPYEPRAPLEADLDVDVCIVGAGIGGLSAAWHLADAGVSAVVVEARTVASGASGRNGGFLIAGAAPAHDEARVRFGRELATAIHRATLAAQQRVYEIAAEIGADASFRRVGSLRVATDEAEAGNLRAELAALGEDGLPGELVEQDALPPRFRRPGRVGLYTGSDATMQPARWVRSLAGGLERRGVAVYEGTPVDAPLGARDGSGWLLSTPGGRIRAARVVVACDGALPTLVPDYAGRVVTRRLHMLATAPLDERLVPNATSLRHGYEYVQQTPEGRIALGGFSDLDGEASFTDREEPNPAVHERLARYLREELAIDAPVTHRWVGLVGYSGDQRPFAGAVAGAEGLFVAGGYSGTGNLNGFVAGRICAELVAHGSSPDGALYASARSVETAEYGLAAARTGAA